VLQNVYFRDLPIHSAHWASDGNEVCVCLFRLTCDFLLCSKALYEGLLRTRVPEQSAVMQLPTWSPHRNSLSLSLSLSLAHTLSFSHSLSLSLSLSHSLPFSLLPFQIILSGRRKFFYSYDVPTGSIRKVAEIQGETVASVHVSVRVSVSVCLSVCLSLVSIRLFVLTNTHMLT
jgi:hypothetical protein